MQYATRVNGIHKSCKVQFRAEPHLIATYPSDALSLEGWNFIHPNRILNSRSPNICMSAKREVIVVGRTPDSSDKPYFSLLILKYLVLNEVMSRVGRDKYTQMQQSL